MFEHYAIFLYCKNQYNSDAICITVTQHYKIQKVIHGELAHYQTKTDKL